MARSAPAVEITVYTLPWCVHCARARALLARRGLDYHEVDGTAVPDFRQALVELTGRYTVPQIMIDGEPIGGADRLAALDRLGVLAAIASGEQFPITREIRRASPRSLVRWIGARVRGRHDVPAAESVRVRIDRSGRVVDNEYVDEVESAKEDHDGEGMCRTAG